MMHTPALSARAELYLLLAEALVDPPEWMAQPGQRWPLLENVLTVNDQAGSEAVAEALAAIAAIHAEDMSKRRQRYQKLLTTQGVHMHESLARDARLSGPITFTIWSLYRAVGLMIPGADLPDHVSVELAFIAHLLERERDSHEEKGQWQKARRMFIKQHASQWMPALGRALAQTGDIVYRPIGLLLQAIIRQELLPHNKRSMGSRRALPMLSAAIPCNLCGFCVQSCPTKAFAIVETNDTTSLLLNDAECVSCGKCVQVCSTTTLQLEPALPDKGVRILFESPRSHCPGCDLPTVSQAEIEAISEYIGRPKWLDYCSECRIIMLETRA